MTDPTPTLTADTLIMFHRCAECGMTWNGTYAAWRTDSTRNRCNECQAEHDADEDAMIRYLDGEFDNTGEENDLMERYLDGELDDVMYGDDADALD